MSISPQELRPFISRWRASGAAERANFAKFVIEFCDLIGVDAPEATMADELPNAYLFEKVVPLPHGTLGRIDLYKRGCFVLEAKQGSDKGEANLRRGMAVRRTVPWDTAMEKAKQQAQSYARGLPAHEIRQERPPFLIERISGTSLPDSCSLRKCGCRERIERIAVSGFRKRIERISGTD